MDSNKMLEEHMSGLSKQVVNLIARVEELESRSNFYENVLITLITALKEGGVIVEDKNGKNEMPS